MCDDIFGGMFDFNGDGHTDMAEELTGLMIFNELEKEDSKDDFDSDFDDNSDFYIFFL